MFSLLKLSHAEIDAARLQHGVYIVHDGRINIAGLPLVRIPDFVNAVLAIQRPWGKSIGCGAVLAVHEDFRRPTRHIILNVCK
jgi:hypothetical protein